MRWSHCPQARGVASPILIEVGYWVLPKPMDCVLLLGDVLKSEQHFRTTPVLPAGAVRPIGDGTIDAHLAVFHWGNVDVGRTEVCPPGLLKRVESLGKET